MKVKPMIFNTEMVKAILDGRKAVTRRPVKVDYERGMNGPVVRGKNGEVSVLSFAPIAGLCPFGNVGDLIYVRETFRLFNNSDECGCSDHCSCPPTGTPIYLATSGDDSESKWTPSIHMPRSVNRLTLKVTGVHIEKLNDLRKSEEQIKKEGFENWPRFKHVWESIYGQSNPNDYVWVIEFEVIHQNVDKYLESIGEAA
ncbi:hypothetical protein P0F39_002683 [Vibrio metschnikovii]|uniref:ASCH domain-containing protein n=1 Tax=unclassified Vibrio TaxID=2614977 RepID=UPI0013724CA1|nr:MULTISPECIES: ASCH domain-containing protein [unclassified Vibrio]EKO3685631.1 hypothetical protein [Vibrio metschnikovii]EKO3689012.1 hypothetical protein [Vibrio metschnikovii]EKO3781126.1 hypothetical protein [Vibrio metschnikovii]EKO3888112.1 hypothetical protein [Vibrio metschnikovii]EKO3936728.1 hypothetical protein [Vibrio metschnikovii]